MAINTERTTKIKDMQTFAATKRIEHLTAAKNAENRLLFLSMKNLLYILGIW